MYIEQTLWHVPARLVVTLTPHEDAEHWTVLFAATDLFTDDLLAMTGHLQRTVDQVLDLFTAEVRDAQNRAQSARDGWTPPT